MYSSLTDLLKWIEETELVQLCSQSPEDNISSAAVVAVVNEAIESADAEIDSYLLGRWSGLRGYSPVPAEINRMSAILALYYIYLRKRAVSEDWQRQYETILRKLGQAAKGDLSLGLDTSGSVAAEADPQYRTDALDTDDDLDDYDPRKYTQDKLDKL